MAYDITVDNESHNFVIQEHASLLMITNCCMIYESSSKEKYKKRVALNNNSRIVKQLNLYVKI